jgi:hypothetical protein
MRAVSFWMIGWLVLGAAALTLADSTSPPADQAVAFIADIEGPGPVHVRRGAESITARPGDRLLASDRLSVPAGTSLRVVTVSGQTRTLKAGADQDLAQLAQAPAEKSAGGPVGRLVKRLLDRLCRARSGGASPGTATR